jgi:hypothetical protein
MSKFEPGTLIVTVIKQCPGVPGSLLSQPLICWKEYATKRNSDAPDTSVTWP